MMSQTPTLTNSFNERRSRIRERIAGMKLPVNDLGYDAWGLNIDTLEWTLTLLNIFAEKYFRVQVHGIENLPEPGRLILISNHSGTVPMDGGLIIDAVANQAKHPRLVRAMVEKFVATMPIVSTLYYRMGQVIGSPENCRQLLLKEQTILAFPEGVRGINKPFSKRYQLQNFGQGFVRLALETNTPIVPVAVIGMEEAMPTLYNFELLAHLVGLPSIPVPAVPFYLPLKIHIYFGEPIHFEGDYDDTDEVIQEKVEQVKSKVQSMIHIGLKERESLL